MQPREDLPVRAVAEAAAGALADMAADLPYANPVDSEALHAGIEFERWLVDACRNVR